MSCTLGLMFDIKKSNSYNILLNAVSIVKMAI